MVKHLREWLGITAEQTGLHGRLKAAEEFAVETANVVVRLRSRIETLEGVSGNLGTGQNQICQDLENIRCIVTTKQPKPAVRQARSWSEVQRLMGDEALQ